MKHINSHSDRLKKAIQKIEDLERENEDLRKKLSQLQPTTPQSEQQSAPTTPRKDPISADNHFAKPTSASLSRVLSKSQRPESPKLKSPESAVKKSPSATVSIRGEEYIYKDGVPVPVAPSHHQWVAQPGFMNATASTALRQCEINYRTIERRSEIDLRRYCLTRPGSVTTPPTDDTGREWGDPHEHSEDEWCEPPLPIPLSEFFDDDEIVDEEANAQDAVQNDLAQISSLDDNIDPSYHDLMIDTKTSLNYLRRSVKIVQIAIHAAGKNCLRGNIRANLKDGPHLILLGRDELLNWLGTNESEKLARHGYPGPAVYSAIMRTPDLRNAISHPTAYLLQNPVVVDALIRSAQKVAVVLGDKTGAMEARAMRDAVKNAANELLQDINDLHYAVQQPFYEMLDLGFLMKKAVKYASLTMRCRGSDQVRKELADIAKAWDNQRDKKKLT
ncbi:hypothetical protein SAMD00023353_5100420 [Rosellinia necatrix]|uniref:Uncharacterized protein n=1 Tax=Rosellinia necatrix TaxID=77044 RepID=A0A1W2TR38_ROSNE|nr:hypothetical protein SAMD00023353_5100420 [Rosellinia necatrix]